MPKETTSKASTPPGIMLNGNRTSKYYSFSGNFISPLQKQYFCECVLAFHRAEIRVDLTPGYTLETEKHQLGLIIHLFSRKKVEAVLLRAAEVTLGKTPNSKGVYTLGNRFELLKALGYMGD